MVALGKIVLNIAFICTFDSEQWVFSDGRGAKKGKKK